MAVEFVDGTSPDGVDWCTSGTSRRPPGKKSVRNDASAYTFRERLSAKVGLELSLDRVKLCFANSYKFSISNLQVG